MKIILICIVIHLVVMSLYVLIQTHFINHYIYIQSFKTVANSDMFPIKEPRRDIDCI